MGHKANRYAFYGENHSARAGHKAKQSHIKFLRPVHVNGVLFNYACYTIFKGSDWELQKYWPYISGLERTGGIVRRVIIDMKNSLSADAIKQALTRFDSDFEVYNADKPDETTELCRILHPYALIMEVTALATWDLEKRLEQRDEVKVQCPDCKIVLVVDENTEKKLADKVRQAKKDGLIDNFIYCSISATYLSAVIDAL